VKPIRLSDEELRKLFKDGRASNVRFSEEDGGGSMGSLNMVHQLHCVVRTFFAMLNGYVEFKSKCAEFFQEIHISCRLSRYTGLVEHKTYFHEISHWYVLSFLFLCIIKADCST
jgi:hypothetical protein